MQNALFHDAAFSYEKNFQRDSQICSFNGIELRLPFADSEVTRFAMSLPVNLKIESTSDFLRKKVLRQTAQDLGIPLTIANRAKKAVQYATGVDKALGKLARRKGLTTNEYVIDIFRKVYLHTAQ